MIPVEAILTDLINTTHPSWGWEVVLSMPNECQFVADRESVVWDVWSYRSGESIRYNVQVCIKGASPLDEVAKRISWVHGQSSLEDAIDTVRLDAINKLAGWLEGVSGYVV